MAPSIYNKENPILLRAWASINSDRKPQISIEDTERWTIKVLKQTNTLQNLPEEIDLNRMLVEYVNEMQLQKQQVMTFGYEEVVDFIQWLIKDSPQMDHSQEQQREQSKNHQQHQNEPQQQEPVQTQKSIGSNQSQHYQSSDHNQSNSNNFHNSNNLPNIQVNSSPPELTNTQIIKNNDDIGMQVIKQAIKPKQSYKNHLKIIFEHYCRISYAMGNDPTFDQIQHKSQTMTVNKYMIFCRDFNLIGISSQLSRTALVDLFKKNAQCYKQMNCEQFITSLQIISKYLYQSEEEEQVNQSDPSPLMVMMLKYMQIETPVKFRQKMIKMNIKSRSKVMSTSKKQPMNYKFKFVPSNGKGTEQIKLQLEQRKNMRSQKKLKLQQKKQKNQHSFNSKPNLNKNNIESSTKINTKKLNPTIPPIKRQSHLQTNKFSNITGYSNIHKLKNNKNDREENQLQLNAIVSEAKKIVNEDIQVHYNRQRGISEFDFNSDRNNLSTPYSNAPSDLYSNQSKKNLNSLLHRNNTKPPNVIYNKKQQEYDKQLVELFQNDEDEDEFLQEHLNREQKNDHVNKRIAKKLEGFI